MKPSSRMLPLEQKELDGELVVVIRPSEISETIARLVGIHRQPILGQEPNDWMIVVLGTAFVDVCVEKSVGTPSTRRGMVNGACDEAISATLKMKRYLETREGEEA